MRSFVYAALVLASSGSLSAQESVQSMTLRSTAATGRPTRALIGSLLGTLVPIGLAFAATESRPGRDDVRGALILGGIALGPAVGYVMEGAALRGLAGTAVRGVVYGAALGIAVSQDSENLNDLLATDGWVGVGLIGAAALAALDIALVPSYVRGHADAQVGLGPAITPAGIGMGLKASF